MEYHSSAHSLKPNPGQFPFAVLTLCCAVLRCALLAPQHELPETSHVHELELDIDSS